MSLKNCTIKNRIANLCGKAHALSVALSMKSDAQLYRMVRPPGVKQKRKENYRKKETTSIVFILHLFCLHHITNQLTTGAATNIIFISALGEPPYSVQFLYL